MIRVGLTGGIGAGKSVALTRLQELGAVAIDHDLLARAAIARDTVGYDAVVEEFGTGVLTAEGDVDRAALGRIVFADGEARERLNGIVHPEVRRLASEQEAAAVTADPDAVVVHDIPLLVETGQEEAFHLVAVVDAPAPQRIARLTATRGLTDEEARRRVASQAADAERVRVADVVLDGSGTVEDLRDQVDRLWERLREEVLQEQVV